MGDPPLRDGFTLGDVERLAWRAARRSRWLNLTVSPYERYELAWSAIAEEVYARSQAPGERGLVVRGERAISGHVFAELRERGISDRAGRGHRSPTVEYRGFMPRFQAYWFSAGAPVVSHEGRVVEVLALRQVWPRLGRRHRETLAALAVHGDYRAAAAALGVAERSMPTMVYQARKQFFRLWHDRERPSRFWGRDRLMPEPYAKRASRALHRRELRRRARSKTGE